MNQKPERWSKSVIMPDMWFDSDQDPREAGDDPVGERATCERYLRDYRLTIELKCQGLDAAQMASRPVPPSTLSLLGLLRHLGEVERDWRNWITAGEPAGRIYCPAGSDFETVRPDPAQVSQALRIMHEEQDATDRLLAGFEDLGQRAGREQVVIRDLMVHRIEEYARHSGHADLLRECFDGRVGQ